MAKNKKCVTCHGDTEGYTTQKVTHKDGRKGVIHVNFSCRTKARSAGWIV